MYRAAPAKINIGLHITQKRPDGWHDIESILAPIDWHDIVEIVPSSKEDDALHLSGLPIPGKKEDNLFFKLLRLLRAEKILPEEARFEAHIHKSIPIGAGLGGGSSDAAAALAILRALGSIRIDTSTAMDILAETGSDCPFFFSSLPALARGKGEIITPLEIDLKGYIFALAHPPIDIKTDWAYSVCRPSTPKIDLQEAIREPIKDWKKYIKNDFEEPIFKRYPELSAIKKTIYDAGAMYASMSGSGSVVYGIFSQTDYDRDELASGLKKNLQADVGVRIARMYAEERE